MNALSDDAVCQVIACVLRVPDRAALHAIFRAFCVSSRRMHGLLHTRIRSSFTGPYIRCDAPFAPDDADPRALADSIARDFRALPHMRAVAVSAGAWCSRHISQPPASCYRRVALDHPVVHRMATLLRCLDPRAEWIRGVRELCVEDSWLDSCAEIGHLTGLVRLGLVACRCLTTAGLTSLGDLRALTIDTLVFYTKRRSCGTFGGPMLPTTRSLTLERLTALDTLTIRRMPACTLWGLGACASLRSLTVESLYTNLEWSMARPNDVDALRLLTQLTSLRVFNVQSGDVLASLRHVPTLRSLTLDSCGYVDAPTGCCAVLVVPGSECFASNELRTNWY